MRKQYKNGSLSTKISLTFIIIIFTVMGSFAFILYCYFQNTIKEHVTKVVNTTTISNAEMMDHLLRRIEIACDLVHDSDNIYAMNSTEEPAISKMIVNYVHKRNYDNLVKLMEDYEDSLKLFNDYFTTCFGENTGYSNILFVHDEWDIFQVMPRRTLKEGGNGFSRDARIKEEEWYQKALEAEGEPYWFLEEGSGQLCMAQKLIYRHVELGMQVEEDMLGVIAVKFDISAISKNLDLSSLTPDSRVILFDQKNEVVYSNRADKVQLDAADVMGDVKYNSTENISYKGNDYLINVRELPLGLNMMTLVPNEDIYQMASQTIRIIITLGIVMVGIAVFMTIFLSQTIFKPLREFAAYMEEGHTEKFAFAHGRKDELGILYRSYNHLMKKLDESMEKELEATEKKKAIELRALQLQINPHFTYNTLNSVSCLAMLNGQEHIAELIGNLTKIMRYNISNPDKLVRISDEIYMIRQYENIQKSCYRDSISFEYNIAAETEELLIPKLIIQPLVENSLVYGVNPQEKTVYIKLSVFLENEDLVITVWDSGKNADVEKINRYVTGEIDYKVDSLGVRNVYERITIAYGEEAGLTYKLDEAGHTIAMIRIPAKSLETYFDWQSKR